MSKRNNRKRIKLSSVRPAYEEALGTQDGKTDFEGENGVIYSIPHPALMKSEQTEELDELETPEEIAEYFLGEKQYKQFVEDGNDIDSFGMLLAHLGNEFRKRSGKVQVPLS